MAQVLAGRDHVFGGPLPSRYGFVNWARTSARPPAVFAAEFEASATAPAAQPEAERAAAWAPLLSRDARKAKRARKEKRARIVKDTRANGVADAQVEAPRSVCVGGRTLRDRKQTLERMLESEWVCPFGEDPVGDEIIGGVMEKVDLQDSDYRS